MNMEANPPTANAVRPDLPRRSRVVLDMLSMLATGWLPWGIHWTRPGAVPHLLMMGKGSRARFVMCCGHALSRKQADALLAAGIVSFVPAGQAAYQSEAHLVITEIGRTWLSYNWHKAPRRRRVQA
jgi:hypothetical protein